MKAPSALQLTDPSPWVSCWVQGLAAGSRILDLASGSGRNCRWLAAQGFRVLAVDRDADALASLAGIPRVETLIADLEAAPWPLEGRHFDAVVVCRYLHRPLFPAILDAVAPGGQLIYETFMRGNERYGRPSRPEFLLDPGELSRRMTEAGWRIEAQREGVEEIRETDGSIRHAATQAIAARRPN
jgi:SAM-dependent methyltransferase